MGLMMGPYQMGVGATQIIKGYFSEQCSIAHGLLFWHAVCHYCGREWLDVFLVCGIGWPLLPVQYAFVQLLFMVVLSSSN